MWMRHLVVWYSSEHSRVGLRAGLEDLKGFFQPEQLYNHKGSVKIFQIC